MKAAGDGPFSHSWQQLDRRRSEFRVGEPGARASGDLRGRVVDA
jgi:hypothetical protein